MDGPNSRTAPKIWKNLSRLRNRFIHLKITIKCVQKVPALFISFFFFKKECVASMFYRMSDCSP